MNTLMSISEFNQMVESTSFTDACKALVNSSTTTTVATPKELESWAHDAIAAWDFSEARAITRLLEDHVSAPCFYIIENDDNSFGEDIENAAPIYSAEDLQTLGLLASDPEPEEETPSRESIIWQIMDLINHNEVSFQEIKDCFNIYSVCDSYLTNEMRTYVNDCYGVAELYDDDIINDYAKRNYEIDDLFDDDEILEYVRDNYNPDDLLDISWN